MSKRTRKITWARAGVTGVTLSLLPAAAALAFGNGEIVADEIRVAAAGTPACAPSVEPFNVPLEPQPEVLKGAPYSGVGTTEVVTTLADGNRITRTNTMRYFRDNAGRTRTEYQLAAIGPFVPEEARSIVTITDPVAGMRYVLHPEAKRADVFKLANGGAPGPAAGAIFVGGAVTSVNGGTGRGIAVGAPSLVQSAEKGGRVRMSAPQPGDRTPKMIAPAFTGGAHIISPAGEPAAGTGPQFDVVIVNNGTPVCKGGAPKAAEPVSIGEKRIEGLKVTGSRLEFTIDAGAVGNEQPIKVRTDQWFSADLGVVVSSSHHDPMIGDTTYRLEQINRTEPDQTLFAVPSDYTKNSMGF